MQKFVRLLAFFNFMDFSELFLNKPSSKNMKRNKISRKAHSLTEYLVISEKGKITKNNWPILSGDFPTTYFSSLTLYKEVM